LEASERNEGTMRKGFMASLVKNPKEERRGRGQGDWGESCAHFCGPRKKLDERRKGAVTLRILRLNLSLP